MNEAALTMIAQELVCRVRDDDAESNGRWLAAMTTQDERWALLFMLAAAVPDDRSWAELTGWTNGCGGPDTPHTIGRRRRDLLEALDGRVGTNGHNKVKTSHPLSRTAA